MKLSTFTTLRSRVYYGWIMVATAIVVQSVMSGLLGQAFGAYVVLLQEDLDWSKASIAGAMSLMSLESGLLGPLGGWLVDRFGPRTTMRIGLSAFGIGLMLFSQVDSLPGFYFAFAIMAIGQSLGGFMPLTVAIVNWFQRRRATALATMQMGTHWEGWPFRSWCSPSRPSAGVRPPSYRVSSCSPSAFRSRS